MLTLVRVVRRLREKGMKANYNFKLERKNLVDIVSRGWRRAAVLIMPKKIV